MVSYVANPYLLPGKLEEIEVEYYCISTTDMGDHPNQRDPAPSTSLGYAMLKGFHTPLHNLNAASVLSDNNFEESIECAGRRELPAWSVGFSRLKSTWSLPLDELSNLSESPHSRLLRILLLCLWKSSEKWALQDSSFVWGSASRSSLLRNDLIGVAQNSLNLH